VRTELHSALVDLGRGTRPQRHLEIDAEPDGQFRLFDNGTVVRSGIDPAIAVATVVWRLNAIAAGSRRHLVIHAGSVADECAVLLPGQSGAGKSTLVAACISDGLSYLSDEYAVVDLGDGAIVPYAKPIGLEREQLVAASDLRSGSVAVRLPPGGIVFPRYASDEPSSVTRLDVGSTLMALAAHAPNLAAVAANALPWLAAIAVACPAWQITYHDTAAAVATVHGASRRTPTVLRAAEVIGPVTPTTTTVVVGDDLAVFDDVGGRLHLLNAGAAFVWSCVPDASDRVGLVEIVLAGAPAGSMDRSDVSETVERLERGGLLPYPSA